MGVIVGTGVLAWVVLATLCLRVTALVGVEDACHNAACLIDLLSGSLGHIPKSKPIEQHIKELGYPLESHEIYTSDGYILTYHRIPHGKTAPGGSSRPPLLLQHGILVSSASWVLANYSLGFALADAGFDVWLGNTRGNKYSRKHVKYDPDEDKFIFWDFSWHEMGYHDLPAGIDYILDTTNTSQLFYVGHSMGTTMYFVMGATRPEYMDKIQAAVMLAPVIYPINCNGALVKFLIHMDFILSTLSSTLGMYEVFPFTRSVQWINRYICSVVLFHSLCDDLVYLMVGVDGEGLQRIDYNTLMLYEPSGVSAKTIRHFVQISKDKDFKPYDYGEVGNMAKYNSPTPPDYDISQVKAPLFIYYGDDDWLAVPKDVTYAIKHLPSVKNVTQVSDKKFNHIDFVLAVNAKTLVYDDVIATLHRVMENGDSMIQ